VSGLLERLLVPRARRERMAQAEEAYAARPRPLLFADHQEALDELDAAIDRILVAAASVPTSVYPSEQDDEPETTE